MAMLALMLATTAAAFSFEPKIVNGTPVDYSDPDDPRYIVGVFPDGGICGGSYLGDRKVVTAAHCTEGASRVRVAFTESGQMFQGNGAFGTDVILIDAVVVREHPNYEDTTALNNDVAIVFLEEDAPAYAQPVQIASPQQSLDIIADGSTLTAYGWGTTSSGGFLSAQLLKVDVHANSMAQCRSVYGTSSITTKMICAGAFDNGDSCQGDSGGPLVLNDGGMPYLVGITSFGFGCNDPNVPGVYARASEFTEWIDSLTLGYALIAANVIDARTGNGSLGFGFLIILLGGLLVRRR
ncbi:serine protease [Salinispirillum sp. LH 10-3-1]|uniref:Serine protease n=1 Tax=Salinispirillum sp. LH 10-3-1 TaxID=2952525 RepID=A0AB38YHF0_9GAMM